ncbi:MAG: TraR/DksA C4-type zinc finger protein [Bacteriovoracaceae bacterium]|nr:TraR/DksA C4-type zinc finger protein [Bacteriovoracaceae bacterium]
MTEKKLTKKQVDSLKKKLLEENQRLIFNGMNNEEFAYSSEERSDEVDQANADFSNSQRLRFRNREVFYAKKINEALKRIEKEEYGQCVDCGANIKFERLLARPTADLCIYCKEESERDESLNFVARQSKSLGKSINLVGAL